MGGTPPVVVDKGRWDRIVELTGGAATTCLGCEECEAVCRWDFCNTGKTDILGMLQNAQLGDRADPTLDEALWKCATCGCCESYCPMGAATADIIVGLRSLAFAEDRVPDHLSPALRSLRRVLVETGPGLGQQQWAADLDLPPIDPNVGSLVYFGPATTADRRVQRIARAFEGVLRAAGLEHGTLESEPDSGALLRVIGAKNRVDELVGANLERLRDAGVREIVVVSPQDYDMFRRIYPRYDGSFRVFHVTEFLDQLIQYGRLTFGLEIDPPRWALYHDPCYLGRRHDVYDAPRRVLQAMPGLQLLEFTESREDAVCCGGGGARMLLSEEPGEGLADERVLEVQDRGADVLVTSCPCCVRMFEESLEKLGVEGIEVRDVVELAAAWWPYAPAEPADMAFGTQNVG